MESIFAAVHFSVADFLVQLFNIVVIVFVLKKFFFEKVNQVMEDRKNEIKDNMLDIDKAWKDANEKEETYQKLLKEVKVQSNEIIGKAHEEGKNLKIELERAGKEEAKAILNQAQKEIENEKKAALIAIQDEVADLVISGAKAVLKEEISEESQKKLIEDFVVKTGELDD